MKNLVKLALIVLFVFVIVVISYNYIFFKFANKHNLEISSSNLFDKKSNFTINKIILYSSAYGTNKNDNFSQSNWLLDLWQYTDIAVFLDNNSDELTPHNTIKKLYLEDVHIYSPPQIGSSSLYYLDSQYFGTEKYNKDFVIEDNLEYTVLNYSNKDNAIQTITPVLFSDLSNPITLKYINNNIYNNFTVPANEPISFDGNLLNRANISTSSLNSSLSFYIVLVNNNNDTFKCQINIDIPLKSIDSGYVLEIKNDLNYALFKQ